MAKAIHLGFEVGTGQSIEIPLRNTAVTGQTQESGKTTTLEALVSRGDTSAIAFVTKRGESAFLSGNRLQPYFRDRADWQFVDQLISAQLGEKNRWLRQWFIPICRDTKTLADVHRAIKKGLEKATGQKHGAFVQLDAYLDLIVPEINRAPMARTIDLEQGLNVMDVSGYSTPMQMLFVQSAIDWVNEHARGVITIVPEAWEFIPEGKGSPVKASAIALVRKGSGLGNYIWVDSQDMAGVDKTILRGCPVWLIGVQREANEIKRNLSNIPAGIRRPSPADIANLDRGQFYACWKDRTVKVYVQPAWMQETIAKSVSLGKLDSSTLSFIPEKKKEEHVTSQEATQLSEENARLRTENEKLLQRLEALEIGARPKETPAAPAIAPNGHGDTESLYRLIKARLIAEEPALLRVLLTKPELRVEVTRRTLDASGDTLRGRIGVLIARDFFDSPRAGTAIEAELRRQGFPCSRPNCYREADKLAVEGFLTKEDGGYQAVQGMKVNVVEV